MVASTGLNCMRLHDKEHLRGLVHNQQVAVQVRQAPSGATSAENFLIAEGDIAGEPQDFSLASHPRQIVSLGVSHSACSLCTWSGGRGMMEREWKGVVGKLPTGGMAGLPQAVGFCKLVAFVLTPGV